MAEEERFSAQVKLVKEILQMLQEHATWKVLASTVFVASALLVLCEIPLITIILGSMYETIRRTIVLTLMFSVACFSYKCVYEIFLYVQDKVKKHFLKKYIEQRKAEEEANEISEVRDILMKLPDKEFSIIRYMKETGGLVWLPVKEGAVLNLYDMGCLVAVLNFSVFRGEALGEHSQCFACKLAPKLEKNINKQDEYIQERLSQVEAASWLSVYEQSLE